MPSARTGPVRYKSPMANNPTGAVLNFPATNGWAGVGGNWNGSVSTGAATFEAWIKTTSPDSQTIVLGSDSPGAMPRISVGGDRLSVYWNTTGEGPGWTSADTTPVTDGQWHHVAVVFDQGAMTFYKDGIATADQLTVGSPQQAAGDFQLGAGLGSTTGFVGQLYDIRVWSVARTAQEINTARWQLPAGSEPGLTVATSFNASNNSITNLAGGAVTGPSNATVVTAVLPFPTFVLSLGGGDDNLLAAGGDLPGSVTFECWLQMSAGQAANRQCLMGTGVPEKGVAAFEYLGGDRLGVTFQGQAYASADTRVISDGAWHHVAAVISSGVITFYKDGVATADTIQIPEPPASLGMFAYVGSVAGAPAFSGQLHQARIWDAARTTAQISGFRYVWLTGPESDLAVLIGFYGSGSADPADQRIVNLAQSDDALPRQGNPAVLIPVQLPQQPLPTNVWTFPTPGEEPVAPSLSPQGTLCIQNTGTDSYLHCVDLQTGQTSWTYDPAAHEGGNFPTSIIPSAVTVSGQQAYLEVELQASDSQGPAAVAELHMVELATGALVTNGPTEIGYYARFRTRPVVLNGTVYLGLATGTADGLVGTTLMWAPVNDQALNFSSWYEDETGAATAMTDPVSDGTNVYVAITKGTSSEVIALPVSSTDDVQPTWHTAAPAAVTANAVLSGSTLFVPAGGTIVALNTATGAQLWSHQLSGAPVQGTPVVLGTTLYVGSTDGTLYALDAATGAEQWRVDTGSAITTDLVNEFGVLYFANAGGPLPAGPAPAFLAVDTSNQGQDVLSYPVPGADTILLDRAGVTNGVAYFYGAQNVYAVNMSTVLHEFSVSTKLIVEDYDTTGSAPVGNNTSYRVTLAIRDENGFPRVSQAVKLWSSDDLYVVNQGAPVTLTADQPVWMQTDTSGNLTLALSAYDDGDPLTGTPNVACPALFAWSNFMPADESIVIYPDHESLTSLSSVQGPTSSTLNRVRDGAPSPLTLQAATDYKDNPLLLQQYQTDPSSLTAIAATVRNTVGAVNPPTVGAGHSGSRPHSRPQRYVRAGVLPNVLHVSDSGSPARPYVPGADPTFTIDLSSGQPVYSTTYDPSAPSAGQHGVGAPLSIFDHISDFVSHVVKGAESVAKMAWTFAKNAVTTVIHTAESVYNLTIATLEDAVTAVTGFFKSVVADIKKVVQWLSALFKWDNILKNHTYIKQAISNPTDPANPGVFDQLATWVSGVLGQGETNDVTNFLSQQLVGKTSAAVGGTAQATTGQTVQSQQGGNNDPNAVYNTGANNNANQCTWMHQKVNENSAGATAGVAAVALVASWDPGPIEAAWGQFMTAVKSALSGSLSELPEQIKQKIASTADSFKDPKSVLSTGLSDLAAVFQVLADDMVDFAERVATEFLQLLDTLITQIVSWLNQPFDIPFVSALYLALTKDQLTLLDLVCLLAAVPGTILLDVITGSPTVPDQVSGDRGVVGLDPGETAGEILFGIAAWAVALVGLSTDVLTLTMAGTPLVSDSPEFTWWSVLDVAVDTVGVAMGMGVALAMAKLTSTEFKVEDWLFWAFSFVPPMINLVFVWVPIPPAETAYSWQVYLDGYLGAMLLVISLGWAFLYPDGYMNAPKAKGLVLCANFFSTVAPVTEGALFDEPGLTEAFLPVMVVKALLFLVGDILGFVANVLGTVDPSETVMIQ
jgi:outer membrane protein assembly factor BamB